MFQLTVDHWSHHAELQIVQADVRLQVGGEIWIDEPLCVDVGLPALLASGLHDAKADRFAPVEQWRNMPFFVCGCGDPECRAYGFYVRHLDNEHVELTEIEQSEDGSVREYKQAIIDKCEYITQILAVARRFLAYIEGRDYRPVYAGTVSRVQEQAAALESALASNPPGEPGG